MNRQQNAVVVLLRALLVLLLLSALVGSAAAGELHGDLKRVGGTAAPGGTVTMRISLSWDGRADLYLPSTPTLKVARGGTVAMGAASSSFDGHRTTWSTTATVQLPERGNRWQVGPGTIVVRQRGGEPQTVELPQLVLGGPTVKRLIGQGLGSALVILAMVLWFLLRDRALRREEARAPGFQGVIAAARTAIEATPFSGTETLTALLALRAALEAAGRAAQEPTADELRGRLEASRFGGEEIAQAECQGWLLALEAAANGG